MTSTKLFDLSGKTAVVTGGAELGRYTEVHRLNA